MKYVVAGIGTDVGKTVVSAVLCEALQASYWKPVQAGLEPTDSDTIKKLVPQATVFPETYTLSQPMSPHAAASIDDVAIDIDRIVLPEAERLIVELAGGSMVPLNETHLNIDLLEKFGLPVVVVANYYLGSINHTLLTLDVLKSRMVDIAGIVFVGECVDTTKDIILSSSGVSLLAEIPMAKKLDQEFVRSESSRLREKQTFESL